MNRYDREHAHNIAAYQKRVQDILDRYEKDITRLASAITSDGDKPFVFSDHPALKARYDRLIRDLSAEMRVTIENGEKAEWGRADAKNDALAVSYTGSKENAAIMGYIARNEEALEAFATRKVNGLDLSGRVWNITDQFSTEIQDAIGIGLNDHLTADELSREVRRLLKHPDMLFRRVRDEYGVLHLSKRAAAYHPGQGVYRSSYMNAKRLAATEINMAYRTSDYMRREKLDFVVGIEIHLSNNHNCKGVPPGKFYDICDELQGKYPKDFKFTGWHPFCYDDKSEVYTDSGWKLFKDVGDSDLILSLNPVTRDLEYTRILLNISRPHKGKMVHFHNRSYSQFVTPEHEVLCVSKSDGRTFRRIEADKCGKSQPVYRSSEWTGETPDSMNVQGISVPFIVFAEFMGYWLADGSLGHKYEVSIAQQDDNRKNIYACIERMGMRPRYNGGKVEFNNRELYGYLSQFGKAVEKFVPSEIKDSGTDAISVFLDAFISCDGHIQKAKRFIGNRGSLCVPKEGERTYYTTSRRMADDIGELILKKGRRPSFGANRTAGKVQRFKNGDYTINHDEIIIRECRSQYATQYEKEYVEYDGMVYDLTLERNNTMYIRREGKCFWGSNCRCYTTTILKTREEMREDTRRRLKGGQPSKDSVNSVKELPDNFKKWLEDNGERIGRAKSLPYFLKDNGRMVDGVWEPYKKVEAPHEPTLLEIAAKRHAERTPEQAQAIKDKWEARNKVVRDYKTLQKRAANIINMESEWTEVDFSELKDIAGSITGKPFFDDKMVDLKNTLQRTISKIKAQQVAEKALSDIIPDIHKWHKEFELVDLKAVKGNVQRVFSRDGWEFDINSKKQLEKLVDLLDHEIEWMSTKGRKYDTWEVAKDAYKMRLGVVRHRITMLDIKESIEGDILTISNSRSGPGKKLLKEFNDFFDNDATPIAVLKGKADEITQRARSIERNRKAKAPTTAAYTPKSNAEVKKEFEDYLKSIGVNADPGKIIVDNGFVHLQGNQHEYIYKYNNIETQAEHDQLWNSVDKRQRTWRSGYIQTSNSFNINGDFRATGVVGKIDAAAEAKLRAHGMTTDDLKTVKLIDKKISEFSLPVPIRVTRYVRTPALEKILGPWADQNSKQDMLALIRQEMPKQTYLIRDPAFLSASTNEYENVFTGFPVKIVIEVPPKTPMYFSNNYQESEIVLGRSTKLKYISSEVETDRNGAHLVVRCRIEQ